MAAAVFYCFLLKVAVRAMNQVRVNNQTTESPAASSQETSQLAARAVSQMADCSSSSDKSQKTNKAMAASGATFEGRVSDAITFYDLMHALPRNVEFVGNLRNRQTVAAHFQDARVALSLAARAALERAPGPAGNVI